MTAVTTHSREREAAEQARRDRVDAEATARDRLRTQLDQAASWQEAVQVMRAQPLSRLMRIASTRDPGELPVNPERYDIESHIYNKIVVWSLMRRQRAQEDAEQQAQWEARRAAHRPALAPPPQQQARSAAGPAPMTAPGDDDLPALLTQTGRAGASVDGITATAQALAGWAVTVLEQMALPDVPSTPAVRRDLGAVHELAEVLAAASTRLSEATTALSSSINTAIDEVGAAAAAADATGDAANYR